MLRSYQVTAVLLLGDAPFHNLHWSGKELAISLDCFVCQRTRRTTWLSQGLEHGRCSGDRKTGPHAAPARISAFDHTSGRDGTTSLRAVVDQWWAPFDDRKRGQAASAPTWAPWVRLNLGYLCPEPRRSAGFSTQRPASPPRRTWSVHRP